MSDLRAVPAWVEQLVAKWKRSCEATRAELLTIRRDHPEGPRYGIAAVESCIDDLLAACPPPCNSLPTDDVGMPIQGQPQMVPSSACLPPWEALERLRKAVAVYDDIQGDDPLGEGYYIKREIIDAARAFIALSTHSPAPTQEPDK